MMQTPETDLLRRMFDAAVETAQPDSCVPPYLPDRPKGRTIVIGAGKSAAAMAAAVEKHWPGSIEGLVVTRYGHGTPTETIEVVEAAHPVPDEAGENAARRILAAVSQLGEDDLVLCLISGGGSALLALPAPGISLDDKQAVTGALLRCGATISEINCVRKHLSAIKGGRLAAACYPARVVTLMISDVPGDDPAVIASGPTVADPSTFEQARAVLRKYAIEAPGPVTRLLAAAEIETPKSDDPIFAHCTAHIIARPGAALSAAADIARQAGYTAVILGDDLEGEARVVAREHAGLAQKASSGTVLLSGGETTVTVSGQGRGGRNAEYALALALALDGECYAIACDTDGIDGMEDNAGAMVTPDTLERARSCGEDAAARLSDNDAYTFFSHLEIGRAHV